MCLAKLGFQLNHSTELFYPIARNTLRQQALREQFKTEILEISSVFIFQSDIIVRDRMRIPKGWRNGLSGEVNRTECRYHDQDILLELACRHQQHSNDEAKINIGKIVETRPVEYCGKHLPTRAPRKFMTNCPRIM